MNMFEAMLYAVLHTLSAQRLWNGAVYSVAPGMVSKFWLGNTKAAPGQGSKSTKTKAQKVGLVEGWLEEGKQRLKLEASAKEMGRRYLEKRRGGSKSVVKLGQTSGTDGDSDEPEIGKLDDLADCLLQGMAWIKWEENRRAIVTDGLDALDNFA